MSTKKPAAKKPATKTATPKLKSYELTAVIPTADYANLQPKINVEAGSMEEAEAFAMPHIKRLSRQYAMPGKELVEKQEDVNTVQVQRDRLKCFATGTEVYYDELGHTYITQDGKKYMSGSNFAKQFEHEFQKHMILPKMAQAHGVEEEMIDEMWAAGAKCSTDFGTALHQALETYGRFKHFADSIGKELSIHPTLLPIVEAFFKDKMNETAVYEPFVADEKNLRCGRIDRLLIVGERECIIEDYKTNIDLYKRPSGAPPSLKAPYAFLPNVPLSKYCIQLSFYRAILEAAGWTVKGIRVWHWDGTEWILKELNPVDIDQPQSPIDVGSVIS